MILNNLNEKCFLYKIYKTEIDEKGYPLYLLDKKLDNINNFTLRNNTEQKSTKNAPFGLEGPLIK